MKVRCCVLCSMVMLALVSCVNNVDVKETIGTTKVEEMTKVEETTVVAAIDNTANEKFEQDIVEIDNYGGLVLNMTTEELQSKGIDYSDAVLVEFLDKEVVMPMMPHHTYVGNGENCLVAAANSNIIVMTYYGDFAKKYGATPDMKVTLSLKEKEGYHRQFIARNTKRTNNREDYKDLDDENYCNFRQVKLGDIKEGVLYRSGSPIDPSLGRCEYVDKCLETYGIKTILNLVDENADKYENYDNTYYSKQKVVFLHMNVDTSSDRFRNGLKKGLEFMIDDTNVSPYLLHCLEGQDRTSIVAGLLGFLCNASFEEVEKDYMTTFYNYYGVKEGTEQYDVIKDNVFVIFNKLFNVEDAKKENLSDLAYKYLIDLGFTDDEVVKIKTLLIK